jgi:hypothetical protein
MSVEIGTAAGRPASLTVSPAELAVREHSRDRWFFSGMAVAAIVITFTGFARTYYLGSYFGARALTPLVHLHGVLSTSWLLLFLAQVSLVARRKVAVHRRLGVAGAVIAALVLVVGCLTAVEGARRGVTPPGGPPPLAFLSVPLGTILAFGTLAAAGLYYRRKPETHKRLMLLATISIVTPAFARIGRLIEVAGPPLAIGGTCLLVLICMLYDRRVHGRVHPVFLWVGLLLMLSLPLRFAIGRTDAWLAVARWLTS